MLGAIIGDLSGSIYEFNQMKGIKRVKYENLIPFNSFYSDDTILTMAILDAYLNDKDYLNYLKKYIKKYKDYKPDYTPYFEYPFSPNTLKWGLSNDNKKGKSNGNGAMMRISPIGYVSKTEEEVIENAYLATIPSHDTKEAIDAAKIIALIIFYLRKGYSKEEVFEKLKLNPRYIPFERFNYTCNETIDNCLYSFYNSTSFEDSIKRTLAMGGDTDTNCAIVGSMAEALYGIDDATKEKVYEKLPDDFVKLLKKVYK